MTELQKKLLDILEWFDAFCEENGLRYYLVGGTMLGAQRHGGFIPWDDDIDVGMPRSDYNKLHNLIANRLCEKYFLETPATAEKDYYYPFSKLYDTTTTLVENTKYAIKRGIYLDIFPLDGIGNSLEESKKNFAEITRTYNFLLSRIGGVRKGRSFYKNLAVIMMRLIPDRVINNKKFLHKLVTTPEKYSFDDCRFCGNLFGAWRFKEVMPKEIMGNPTKIKFEHLQVCGVEKPDEYLTRVYGDWRKLPPVEKQVSHHDFIMIDLNKSYLESEEK